ncbi:MAG: PhzF family phenazine biosynthesis protein [Actinobacteria bacterium]|nr:PhzF family phenazine biosynthesis protein [Actinomycetota bacterium]
MDFLQVDVFADKAFSGNPLAVFPNASALSSAQMQAIASEMNLSETSFVTGISKTTYDVRIFTPAQELPFAGHPTIGTAWTISHLELTAEERLTQRSAAGDTYVFVKDGRWWFVREGAAGEDLEDKDERAAGRIADALGIEPGDIGLEARELGRAGRLRPAVSDAGIGHLMIPVADLEVLQRIRPRAELLAGVTNSGAYCFTGAGAGRIRARGFFPGAGIAEDPATGSAAAELGIYLAARVGALEMEISQGTEIGRPSRIFLRAKPGRVEVGGRCEPVLEGRLSALP